MSENPLDVLIFGLGGIGGFFAFLLKRSQDVTVSVIARSNYDAIKKDGIKIESENHGEHIVKVDNVYKTLSEPGRTFDYLICSHKAINPDSFPPMFENVVDSNTTLVIIQNGAGNEAPFRKEYPQNTIISVVTWVGVTQISPGLIKHIKIEETHLGLYPNEGADQGLEKKRLDRFEEWLRVGRTKYEVHSDIQIPRWEKMIWNAVWNFTSMITQLDSASWLASSDEATPVTKRLMQEIAEVGKKEGVPLDDGLVDRWYDKMVAIGGVYGSTYVDMKEGRPMEIEIILGTPLRKAREWGVDVPVLSTFYALSMAINGRIQGGKK